MSAARPSGLLGSYTDRIKYLQRAELDDQGLCVSAGEVETALRTALDPGAPLPIWLVEVRGVSRFWRTDQPKDSKASYFTQDILAGLNGQRIPLYFLVRGESKRVRLYVGTLVHEEGSALRALFESQYPGGRLWPARDPLDAHDRDERRKVEAEWQGLQGRLHEVRAFLDGCQHIGVVTGVPTPNVGGPDSPGTQIDRLIRGLYGTEWAFLVLAEPEADTALVDMQLALLREEIRVEQEEEIREWRESAGQTVAAYYHHLLEMRHQFLEACLFEGGWWVQSYICSPDKATYQRAKALVKSIFSGDFSRVDRVRVLDCAGAGRKAASFSPILVERPRAPSVELASGVQRSFKYHTLVSSGQLSALAHLPRVEMPGYYVRESASFDVSSHVPPDAEAVAVGEILDRGRPTGNAYAVRVEDLTQHCLLVGITGSGKTNTTFHLLRQLQQREPPLPFLVVEPAKREYRQLSRLLPPGRELRVFTVGEEGEHAAPFRLNPFEIRPGVPVQTHIDLLKSVFNASFGMWTPLPQVLERAIHEVYRDKGWNPVHGTNDRAVVETAAGTEWHPRAQPTLTDLYHKVAEMVPKLGYDKEVTRNVSTALETRINSLRVGAKGMMLDTPLSIPIEYLLDGPTILELEGVGDDDEKAYVMGLILMALYEYYRVQGPPTDSGVRHVTVIEEAHRLLTNVPVSTDPEASNLRGKAVETFVNMLSEVRAYGEGFLIAEQIPTKLAPDVIKNTALKVMHRTVSNDDREVMGGTMNLTVAQVRQVVALGTGEAVVHGGGHYGDDNAILVKVPLAKGEGREPPVGVEVRRAWERFRDLHDLSAAFLSYPTCEVHCVPPSRRCADARRIAEDESVRQAFAAFVLTLVVGGLSRGEGELPALLHALYGDVAEAMRARFTGPAEDPAHTRCALTHSLYQYMDGRGSQYGWTYEDAAQMTARLLPALLALAASRELGPGLVPDVVSFCEAAARRCRLDYEPFYGCARACGRSPLCLYRYNVEPLLGDQNLAEDFEEAGADWTQMAEACEKAAERVLVFPSDGPWGDSASDVGSVRTAALCFAIQKVHSDPSVWPTRNRQFTIDELLEHYGR
jgi:DNA helicase HerA-like ATPase